MQSVHMDAFYIKGINKAGINKIYKFLKTKVAESRNDKTSRALEVHIDEMSHNVYFTTLII